MGILDNVFGGKSGVSAMLHNSLGRSAVIRIKSYARNENNGILMESYDFYTVPFVPASSAETKGPESAPSASRTDIEVPSGTISGTFPCAYLSREITAKQDSIVLDGVEYTIQTIDTLKVGSADVQYSITATRG